MPVYRATVIGMEDMMLKVRGAVRLDGLPNVVSEVLNESYASQDIELNSHGLLMTEMALFEGVGSYEEFSKKMEEGQVSDHDIDGFYRFEDSLYFSTNSELAPEELEGVIIGFY